MHFKTIFSYFPKKNFFELFWNMQQLEKYTTLLNVSCTVGQSSVTQKY